jgi:type II secretion system protein G
MKDERGFTLLELMIVVAIIAIIAGILVPSFFHARAQAAVSACEGNLRSISTAAELYFDDTQQYPSVGKGMLVMAGFPGTGGTAGGYLTQTPTDPAFVVGQGPTATNNYTFTGDDTNGYWTYTIQCPGTHDPSSVVNVPGGPGVKTGTTLNYGSVTGFGVGAPPVQPEPSPGQGNGG